MSGGSTLIVFAVALQHCFIQPATLTRAQRLFQDLSVVVSLTHGLGLLVLNPAAGRWAIAGIAMYAVSLALFLSAIEAARRTPMTRGLFTSPSATSFYPPVHTV